MVDTGVYRDSGETEWEEAATTWSRSYGIRVSGKIYARASDKE